MSLVAVILSVFTAYATMFPQTCVEWPSLIGNELSDSLLTHFPLLIHLPLW